MESISSALFQQSMSQEHLGIALRVRYGQPRKPKVADIRTNVVPAVRVVKKSLKKMRKDTTEYIDVLMREFLSRLSESAEVVKDECSADAAKAYLRPVSQIMVLSFAVLDLIYKQYPELVLTEEGE